MRRSLIGSLIAAVVAALCVGLAAQPATPAPGSIPDRLDAYTARVTPAELSGLAGQGLDVSAQRQVRGAIELDLVLDRTQAARLRDQGVDVRLTRVKDGRTVRQFAAAQAAGGASRSGGPTMSRAASATRCMPRPGRIPSW